MTFSRPFTDREKIELLQRSILVNSFTYYELNQNILTDFQYDTNAKQLAALRRASPEDFKNSRYYMYFHDFCSDTDNQHFTSGFDLLRKVEKKDPELYCHIWIDSLMALDLKREARDA